MFTGSCVEMGKGNPKPAVFIFTPKSGYCLPSSHYAHLTMHTLSSRAHHDNLPFQGGEFENHQQDPTADWRSPLLRISSALAFVAGDQFWKKTQYKIQTFSILAAPVYNSALFDPACAPCSPSSQAIASRAKNSEVQKRHCHCLCFLRWRLVPHAGGPTLSLLATCGREKLQVADWRMCEVLIVENTPTSNRYDSFSDDVREINTV